MEVLNFKAQLPFTMTGNEIFERKAHSTGTVFGKLRL